MLVYVMGRAHTGSTILDILLGSSSHIESIGQLASHIAKTDSLCSCRLPIRDCPFWQKVHRRVEADTGSSWSEIADTITRQAHVIAFAKTLLAKTPLGYSREHVAKIHHYSTSVDQAIRDISGKEIVVDSSKEPTRALFLAKYTNQTRFIFLVRNPFSVVNSYYWRFKDKWPFHFLRRELPSRFIWPFYMVIAAASWTAGNILYEIVVRFAKYRTLRVRYEDLCNDPKGTLRDVSAFLDFDCDEVIDMIESNADFPIGHNIGGNQIREEGQTVRFEPKKDSTRPTLPLAFRAMTLALCWPLMGRYGYARRLSSG